LKLFAGRWPSWYNNQNQGASLEFGFHWGISDEVHFEVLYFLLINDVCQVKNLHVGQGFRVLLQLATKAENPFRKSGSWEFLVPVSQIVISDRDYP